MNTTTLPPALPPLKVLTLCDDILRAYRNREYIKNFKTMMNQSDKIPDEFSKNFVYIDHLEGLISSAYSYSCLGHYQKAASYYNMYKEKYHALNIVKDKIVTTVSELIALEKEISEFDSVWFELSRLANRTNTDFKNLYARVKNYKEISKPSLDIICRRNILSALVSCIKETYKVECKRMLDGPVLKMLRTERNPGVDFNTLTGKYNLFGRALTTASDDFWAPVLAFLQKKAESLSGGVFTVNLDYFNSIAANNIFKVLRIVSNNNCEIICKYDGSDLAMKESYAVFKELCDDYENFRIEPNIMSKQSIH